jgi:glycosyltransferase involved in cell wall biosynthesis
MLTLCIITKNEEKNLPKLFESIVPYVDKVVITDTGSTDKTKEISEKYCGEKLKWTTFEWCDDFSAARNYNFSQADKNSWVIWADADDTILNAKELKSIIKDCEKNGINSVMFPYHYVVDEYGNTTCLQRRERIVKNDGTYKWIGRLHEAMLPVSKMAAAASLDNVIWVHRAKGERIEQSKLRNLDILEKALEQEIKEDKVDPRTLYNLGNAYFTVDQYQKALACYAKYIPMSGWDEEIYLARHRSALVLLYSKEFVLAEEAALKAMSVKPEYPDAYIDIGKVCYEMREYKKAIYWFKEAMTKEVPKNLPVYNPMDYTANLYWLLAHSLAQNENYLEAYEYFKKFQVYYPKNEEVVEILETLENALDEADDVKAIVRVARLTNDLVLKNNQNENKLWSVIPRKYLEIPEVLYFKNQLFTKKTSTGKEMAIYCGKCIVEWDPSLEKAGGIGGSEEAVINITRLLAQRGWKITVFGRPIKEGNYDGVDYKHYTEYNPRDKYDVFITWRMPGALTNGVNADRKYVWLHDVTPEDCYEEEIDDSIDYVVGLMDEQFTNFIKERKNTWLGRHTRELGHWTFDYFDKSYKQWDSFRIKFVVESGYYQGAKFDLDFSDRQGISKTMEKKVDALVRKVERILAKVTTPLAVYARFSNGETWYQKA